jgi:hypothetical protein
VSLQLRTATTVAPPRRCLQAQLRPRIGSVLEIATSATTSLTPEQVIRVAADFSDTRQKLSPNSKTKYLRTHERGADFVEVTEGFRFLGVFWERSRYDWSEPRTIRQTVVDSNVVRVRSTWELVATPQGDGSEVVMHLRREFRPSLRGRIGRVPNQLAGARMWGSYLRKALSEAESRLR